MDKEFNESTTAPARDESFLSRRGMITTVITTLISVLIYSLFLGFWLSLFFILVALIHEMGHFLAFRIKKVKSSWPVFIPFLGAIISSSDPNMESDRDREAFIGYGGPLLGSLGAGMLFVVSLFFQSSPLYKYMTLAAFLGTFLNLFNFIPLRPLDGGRVAHAISDWLIYLGGAIFIVVLIWFHGFLLIFFWLWMLKSAKIHPKMRLCTGILLQFSLNLIFLQTTSFSGHSPLTFVWIILVNIFILKYNRSYYLMNKLFNEANLKSNNNLDWRSIWWEIKKKECGQGYELCIITLTSEQKAKMYPDKLPLSKRFKWAGLYLALLIFLSFLFYVQFQQVLPYIKHFVK